MNIKTIVISFAVLTSLFLIYYGITKYEQARLQYYTKNTNDKAKLENEILVYKEPTCQCCGGWINYLKNNGYKVKTETTTNIEEIKNKFNIPQRLRSCHTAVVGKYIIEGHVPLPAIEKLLNEKPDILGIALPGMPAGSPGMGGLKQQTFTIYSFTENNKIERFIEL